MGRTRTTVFKSLIVASMIAGVSASLHAEDMSKAPTGEEAPADWLDAYNVVWTTQSANAGDSMPVSGGDVGLNVWVENNRLMFLAWTNQAAQVDYIKND